MTALKGEIAGENSIAVIGTATGKNSLGVLGQGELPANKEENMCNNTSKIQRNDRRKWLALFAILLGFLLWSSAYSQSQSVIIYENPNFEGRSRTLAVGSYHFFTNTNEDFNDIASSIRVPTGLAAIIYEHANDNGGYGISVDLLEDHPDLSKYNFSDKVSYIKVFISNRPDGFLWARNSIQNGQFIPGHWERARARGNPAVNTIAVVSPPLPPPSGGSPDGEPVVRDHRGEPPRRPPPVLPSDSEPVVRDHRGDPSSVPVGPPPGSGSEELAASTYVQNAQNGFRDSPAGGTHIGNVLVRAPLPGEYGRHANSTGGPIGGNYGPWVSPPSEGSVRTLAQLESALNEHLNAVQVAIAQNTPMPRRTIFVAADAEIELGAASLVIPPGVTLASSRGLDRSPGGLIKSTSDTKGASFVILSRSALGTTRPLAPIRITGLRFQGPNPHESPPDFWDCSAKGRTAIFAFEEGHREDPANIVDRVLEIDNNEFSSWPAAAIEIGGIRGGYVHHNYIHHSQRNPQEKPPCAAKVWGWHARGYGVVINNGLVYIEANFFQHNRHSIASRGDGFTDYVAMYNLLGEDGPSHHFDVHGGEDREDGTHTAGRNIVIAYNTDYGTNEDAVNIRGNPVSGAWVTGNQFSGSRDRIKQTKVPRACKSVFVIGRPGHWENQCTYFPKGLSVRNNIYNYREKGAGGNPPGSETPHMEH